MSREDGRLKRVVLASPHGAHVAVEGSDLVVTTGGHANGRHTIHEKGDNALKAVIPDTWVIVLDHET